jgi:hypothetical protein
MPIELSLIVLKVADLEHARAFCEALGLAFVKEQHEHGPLHYAAQAGSAVLELYPVGSKDALPGGPSRLVFACRLWR